eukprot:1154019-Pelagomonas_calceolata.AAC.1
MWRSRLRRWLTRKPHRGQWMGWYGSDLGRLALRTNKRRITMLPTLEDASEQAHAKCMLGCDRLGTGKLICYSMGSVWAGTQAPWAASNRNKNKRIVEMADHEIMPK